MTDRRVQVTVGSVVLNGLLSHLLDLARSGPGGDDASVAMVLHARDCPDCTATRHWQPQVIDGGQAELFHGITDRR